MYFKFEIVNTINGLPDTGSVERGLAYRTEFDGAAFVVIEEFNNESEAKAEECVGEECGQSSQVWMKYSPNQSLHSPLGADVYYIGPTSKEEYLEFLTKQAEQEALLEEV